MPLHCLFKSKLHALLAVGVESEGALLALQLQSTQSLL